MNTTENANSSERTWAALCHLSALIAFLGVPLGNIFGPLVVWLIRRGDSATADAHGKEALNFQISLTVYLLIATAATVGLMLVLIGFLLLPLLIGAAIIVPIVGLVFTLIAGFKAGNGEFYRYPLTLRFIN